MTSDGDKTCSDDSVRKLPEQTPRVETGPVQFGDDWPGVFIRGDNAFAFAISLRHVLAEVADAPDMTLHAAMLRGLLSDLEASRV